MPLSCPLGRSRSMLIALAITICSTSLASAAIVRDPTKVLLRRDDLILSDLSTEDQSLDRAYAAGYSFSQSLAAGDSLFVKFSGGVEGVSQTTPNPLDFHFRIYFDRGDGQSLHTFEQVLGMSASGTHTLTAAPPGVATAWNEYQVEIMLDRNFIAGTQHWLEVGEGDFQTKVLDPLHRDPFYLLPALSSDGTPIVYDVISGMARPGSGLIPQRFIFTPTPRHQSRKPRRSHGRWCLQATNCYYVA